MLKVTTKILADRLAIIASRIISPNQFGFIRGRNIEDCIVVVSECLDALNNRCFGDNIVVKVDMRKVLDTMD